MEKTGKYFYIPNNKLRCNTPPKTPRIKEIKSQVSSFILKFRDRSYLTCQAKLYTPSTPNNSNETHNFMCLGRTGRFGQH